MLLLTLLFFLWATAFCLPFPAGNTSIGVSLKDVDEALFKGINWEIAHKPGNCNKEQLAILRRSTEVALQMLNPAGLGEIDDSNAWDWFFKSEQHITDKKKGWKKKGDVGDLLFLCLCSRTN